LFSHLGQGGEEKDPVGERLGAGQLHGAGDLPDGLQHDLLQSTAPPRPHRRIPRARRAGIRRRREKAEEAGAAAARSSDITAAPAALDGAMVAIADAVMVTGVGGREESGGSGS
jgi:hypothetical protein